MQEPEYTPVEDAKLLLVAWRRQQLCIEQSLLFAVKRLLQCPASDHAGAEFLDSGEAQLLQHLRTVLEGDMWQGKCFGGSWVRAWLEWKKQFNVEDAYECGKIVGRKSELKRRNNWRWYFVSAPYLEPIAGEYVHAHTKLIRQAMGPSLERRVSFQEQQERGRRGGRSPVADRANTDTSSHALASTRTQSRRAFSCPPGSGSRSGLHRGILIEDVQRGVPLQLDPLSVRFTHDEISARFRDGRWVDQIIEDVLNGLIAASDIPPCHLVRWGSGMYSLSNRRLFVFRVLRVMGRIDVLDGELFDFDSDRVQRKSSFGWRITGMAGITGMKSS